MLRYLIKRKPLFPALLLPVVLLLAVLTFSAIHANADEPGGEIRDFAYQSIASDTVESDATSLRFIFSIDSLHYIRVGFAFSKTNSSPTVGGDGCTVKYTTEVYSVIYADGNPIAATPGRYWVAVKVTGIDNDYFDAPLYVNAFVEDGSGIRYASPQKITVCEAFGNEKIAEDFVPILRFVVASDVHYNAEPDEQDVKFHTLLSDAYEYSDGHAKYNTLDGVFIVGDFAHRGWADPMNRFFDDLDDYTRQETVAMAVLGNHEFWPEPEETVSRFLSASGYENKSQHITVSGYHFILMSTDNYNGFNDSSITWLSNQLALAAADDPTGKKPIFVFQHHPAYDTVYGSFDGEWGVTNLEPVLELYPQAVDFSGHSHFPVNDPRSVWQGTFTEFNTGSCREFGMDIAGYSNTSVFAKDNAGAWTEDEFPEDYLFDPGKYYVVEVNAANRILVRAFDVGTDAEVIEPIFLSSVGNPERFAYTDARADAEETPRFALNAEVETLSLSSVAAEFRFPRTARGAYVQNYRCEIREGETLIDTVYRLDCGFLFPAPETLTLAFSGLDPETEYTVSITPVTSWANEGEPLVFNFTTAEIPRMVFSARFGESGTATDGVSGVTLTKRGSPTTVYDGTRDAYYAVFDGNDSFEFYGIADYYSYMSGSFTFETYLCMDAVPKSGKYVAPFANEESGGFGFEYDSNRSLDFWAHIAGDYRNVGTTLETDEWVHLVATFNGSTLILYRNGEVVATRNVSGTVRNPSADHLSVGADSKGNNGSENFATCKVAIANVYRVALTAEEVADLYEAICPD